MNVFPAPYPPHLDAAWLRVQMERFDLTELEIVRLITRVPTRPEWADVPRRPTVPEEKKDAPH